MIDRNCERFIELVDEVESRFRLIFVVSPYYVLQRKWRDDFGREMERRERSTIGIKGEDIEKTLGSKTLMELFQSKIPATGKWVLNLTDLETTIRLLNRETETGPYLLNRLNEERDGLARLIGGPLVIWVSKQAMRYFAELAPDFYDYRGFVVEIPPAPSLGQFFLSFGARAPVLRPSPRQYTEEGWTQLIQRREHLRAIGNHRNAEQGGAYVEILCDLALAFFNPKDSGVLEYLKDALEEADRLQLTGYLPKVRMYLGTLYGEQGDWRAAIVCFKEAAEAFQARLATGGDTPFLLARCYNKWGNAHMNVEDWQEAEPLFRAALNLMMENREHGGDWAFLKAVANNNLALWLIRGGNELEAEPLLKESETIMRELNASSPRSYAAHLAMVLNNRANLLCQLERTVVGERLHRETWQLHRQLAEQDESRYLPDMAMGLHNQALLLADTGPLTERVKALFEEAARIYHKLIDQGMTSYKPNLAMLRFNYGLVLEKAYQKKMSQEQFEMARDWLKDSTGNKLQGFDHLYNTIERRINNNRMPTLA